MQLNPGRLSAKFEHDREFDYINLRIEVQGAISFTHFHDDLRTFRFKKGETIEYPDLYNDTTVYMSSVWCPFTGFVKFLEEVAEGKNSSIEWDPEGPFGEMVWQGLTGEIGYFSLTWQYRPSFELKYRVLLNRHQFVETLYTAFRSFIESPRYDPIRYEDLKAGEAFGLVLTEDNPIKALTDTLIKMDRSGAEWLIDALLDCVHDRKSSLVIDGIPNKLQHDLDYFVQKSKEIVEKPAEPLEGMSKYVPCWIPVDWNFMTTLQKRNDVEGKDGVYFGGIWSWYGKNLRALKSEIVETFIEGHGAKNA
jgi:hypothetical protein